MKSFNSYAFILTILVLLFFCNACKSNSGQNEESAKTTESNKDVTKIENRVSELMPGTSIHPFGSIEWTDSLYDVVSKLNTKEGVKSVILNGGIIGDIDLTGISSRDKIDSKIESAIQGASQFISVDLSRDIFVNGNGVESNLLDLNFSIFASGINLSGVPFSMKIEFSKNSGVAVLFPSNYFVTIMEDDQNKKHVLAMPVYLDNMEMTSETPVDEARRANLVNLFCEKYKEFDTDSPSAVDNRFKKFRGNDWLSLEDKFGNKLIITPKGNQDGFSFTYKISTNYSNKVLEEAYVDHLAKMAAKKMKNTPDSGGRI